MSVSKTDRSGSVSKQAVIKVVNKQGLKKVVKKKHSPKKKSAIGRITNKKLVARRALVMSEFEFEAGPKSVSVEDVEEIVSDYREHTRKKLAKEFPKIVDNMLAAAKSGRLTDTKMKFLMDLAGVKDDRNDLSDRMSGPSLGKLLLLEIEQRRKAAMAACGEETYVQLVASSGVLEGAASRRQAAAAWSRALVKSTQSWR